MYIKKVPVNEVCTICGYLCKCVVLVRCVVIVREGEFIYNTIKINMCHKCCDSFCDEIKQVARRIENEDLLG
jgi:hypothetical protein